MYIKLRKVFVHTSLNHPVYRKYISNYFLLAVKKERCYNSDTICLACAHGRKFIILLPDSLIFGVKFNKYKKT